MKIELLSEQLRNELAQAKSVVDDKSKHAALSNVLLVTSDKPSAQGVLRITGTDLDHTIICDTEAKIVETGALCVRAKHLFEIAKHLPDGKVVTITSEPNNWAMVVCESSQFRVAGVPPENFPEIARVKETATRAQINVERLRTFISRTIFAITQEESRYTLSGALVVMTKSHDQMVTTDGHRLAFIEGNGTSRPGIENELRALITRKTLSELQRLTQGMKSDILFSKDENHLHFMLGNRQLLARQLSGQFPNWEMIMPKQHAHQAVLHVGSLRDALKRVALMTEERSYCVSFHFKPGTLTLHAQSAEQGEAHETVEIEGYEGDEMEIKLNVEYVQQPLEALSTDSAIEIQMKDAQTQIVMRPLGETGVVNKNVIMPMRF